MLADSDGQPEVILVGTGSEVALCVQAFEQLAAEGIKARVVSLPCWELFDAQPESYRREVLPPEVTARVGVEAGVESGWSKYLGPLGRFIGMHTFGTSAPAKTAFAHFGITAQRIVTEAEQLVGR